MPAEFFSSPGSIPTDYMVRHHRGIFALPVETRRI